MKIAGTPSSPGFEKPLEAMLGWRTRFGFGWLEWLLLTGYALVIGLVLPHHEPWSDEAQAWMIARDNSIWEILRYRLHYEGAPGLWHVLLHLFQITGGRYAGMGWLGASFAVAGIVVFLRWSPFPLLIRLLLPFTFFLQYQYAVVARGYTLFPLLAFLLCVLFRNRRHMLWFALVAGLLANISLQGTVYSFCLFLLYLFQHEWRPARASTPSPARWRPLLLPTAAYLGFLAVAALTAVPAPDCDIANGGPVTSGPVAEALQHFPGPLPRSEWLPVPPLYAQQAHMDLPPPPPLPPDPAHPEPSLLRHPGAWSFWYIHHDPVGTNGQILPHLVSQSLLEVTVELLNLITGPLSTSKLLSVAFLLILGVWLWFRHSVQLLLPWAGNVVVGEALWIADHHTGMLFLALLTAMWIAVQTPERVQSSRVVPYRLDRALIVVLAAICVLQITWTVVSAKNDVYKNYDPSRETVALLKQHPQERMASFDFFATDVQPYFAQNPFFNLPHGYWVWNTTNNPNGAHFTTIEQHPSLVLFSEDMLASGFMHNDWAPLSPLNVRTQDRDLARNSIILDLKAHGYQETHRFCGDRFMRLSASYRTCHLIFEPAPRPKQR